MAFYDLPKDQREQLLRDLRHRESMEKVGMNPTQELRLSALMSKYRLTPSDMKAILKGMK